MGEVSTELISTFGVLLGQNDIVCFGKGREVFKKVIEVGVGEKVTN